METYEAFEYLIQQGKAQTYLTLQIYIDHFRNTGKYSGIVIFNWLLQCVKNMLKEIAVPEIEVLVKQNEKDRWNEEFLMNKPMLQLLKAIVYLMAVVKEYPGKAEAYIKS